ncbi:MAG TPA: chemotaxis response regulator protein-glutamate methylesterase [Bryobacteraceae bacterium]|jgi:two-component system chemotaxis response regulator CheB|nr:chemotaxis response regulator protein-glutamate methylesterase [Bryobacteraceae bacterium]
MPINGKIRVLVVDDSAIVRKILTEALSGQPDLEVVGTAPDPYIARDKILALQPDVLTLDIEMPRMDGLTFLKKLMRFRPMPVIVISSLAQASCQTALQALSLGAVEVLAKPGGPYSVGELRLELASKIRAAASAHVRAPAKAAAPQPPPRLVASQWTPSTVIAIGASTGGTEAIADILPRLPEGVPGILVTQHIPAGFSRAFAARLNQMCSFEVKEAEDGDALVPGRALVAPGDLHMVLRKSPEGYRVSVKTGPRVCYQRPSVDVMFSSVAEAAGARAVGVLLTGMGSDGAHGLLKMHQSGARTIAQDESSCVVFGMPREAIRLGAADRVMPLPGMPQAILAAISQKG